MLVWTESQKIVLPFALLMIIGLTFLNHLIFRGKLKKYERIPLMIISSLMIIFEIVKQIRAYNSGYQFWSIPLHLCSTFLLWFFLASFFKGKVQRFGQTLAFCCGAMFTLAFYLNPTSIIGNATDTLGFAWSNFGRLHTFYYHHFIILFNTIMLTQKIYVPSLKDSKYAIIGNTVYFAVALIFAQLLNTNFFALLKNIFKPFDRIRTEVGYIPYLIMMYAALIGGSCLALYISSLITNEKKKKSALAIEAN